MNETAAADIAPTAAAATVPLPTTAPPPEGVRTMSRRLREWLRVLHRNPSAEEQASKERRARLLEDLNRAVADAPDDLPLRDVIDRINHPDND